MHGKGGNKPTSRVIESNSATAPVNASALPPSMAPKRSCGKGSGPQFYRIAPQPSPSPLAREARTPGGHDARG